MFRLFLHCQDPFHGITVDEVDRVVRDASTWGRIRTVLDISEECEHIGRWAESCPCQHSDFDMAQRRSKKRQLIRHKGRGFSDLCPYRGCRAWELASGVAHQSQLQSMVGRRDNVMEHIACFPEEQRSSAVSDWEMARSKLWFQLTAKLKYWGELPWKLCVLQKVEANLSLLYGIRAGPIPIVLLLMFRLFLQFLIQFYICFKLLFNHQSSRFFGKPRPRHRYKNEQGFDCFVGSARARMFAQAVSKILEPCLSTFQAGSAERLGPVTVNKRFSSH